MHTANFMRHACANNASWRFRVVQKKAKSIIWPGTPLPRSFFDRVATKVAPQLLNKVLASADGRAGRIVEVEAYLGAIDPAAHTYRGKTPRNAVMFGPPGHMYVYFTYGMHWCANCVSGPEGDGCGVLIRALEPLHGMAQMRAARPRVTSDRDLCRGPARLTQAMGINGTQNGLDLVGAHEGFTILDDGMAPPKTRPGNLRIGISVGKDFPWRWHVPGSLYVSGTAAQRR
jgi:DNA-3-methyladenine glycosylase